MPTASEHPAAARAAEEADVWATLSNTWSEATAPAAWEFRAPLEREVIPEHDPQADLERRAAAWNYSLETADLASLCRFAGALAATEAAGWEDDDAALALPSGARYEKTPSSYVTLIWTVEPPGVS